MDEDTRAYFEEIRRDLSARFDGIDARFDRMDARFDGMDARFDRMDARFDRMDARFGGIDARLDTVDARFDSIDARFGGIDEHLGGIDERFSGIGERFDRVEARITSEVAVARRELGVLIEQVRHQLAIVAEMTVDHGRRLTANEAAVTRLRENMGLQMAELRVAIADLRVRG